METVKDPGLTAVLIPLLIIVFIIAVGVVLLYQHFQKNLVIHKLREEAMKRDHQGELLRANILAQEDERKRIAQDIHDELGATLSIMRMNMMMLERQPSSADPALQTGLQNVRSLTENALSSMRSISHRLMPPQLESFGLLKTLEAAVGQINAAGNLYIHINAAAGPASMPWAVSLGLYRVIMELVNNTIRHSGASHAQLDISQQNNCIVCSYTDNGKGINDREEGNGLGLKSIEGRVSALNGSFELGTARDGGFYAIVSVPLQPAGNNEHTIIQKK